MITFIPKYTNAVGNERQNKCSKIEIKKKNDKCYKKINKNRKTFKQKFINVFCRLTDKPMDKDKKPTKLNCSRENYISPYYTNRLTFDIIEYFRY